jgi:CRISPR-associated protein Csd1
MNMLYTTYENVMKGDTDGLNPPLLPIAHTTQNADIEVQIDIDGNFIRSYVVESDKQTMIPCSESSSSRSGSNPVNHPLFDKLQYLAGDYSAFGGEKGSHFHEKYMADLEDWCNSSYSNEQVQAIYNYLKKGCLISDLVRDGSLICDENNRLLKKWPGSKNDAPKIFKAIIGEQSNAFIRFRVSGGNDAETAAWQNKKVQDDYIDYYLSKQEDKGFCYVTGEIIPCSNNHPSKIRNTGDKAKLISANDDTGFTFRGRFINSGQAVQIGYDISQKAHNALKWLISKQGKNFGDKVFLLWGTNNEKTPDPTRDTCDFPDFETENFAYTKEEIAERFNHAIAGYKAEIDNKTSLALIGLDSATTGRLSITFYREFHGKQGNELIKNIENWHNDCKWHHRYKKKDKNIISFDGAPSPMDIALVAYGTEQNGFLKADNKLIAATVERILPCISDAARLPLDIMRAAVNKCFQPQNYQEVYNWNKVVSIACSLVKKHYKEQGDDWNMELNLDTDDINYNCGRLLAVAHEIERRALKMTGDNNIRNTNAIRYFTKFALYPCKTWGIISDRLGPYIERLGERGNDLYKLKQEISAKISPKAFEEAKNLDGRMALGFDSQRYCFYNSSNKSEKTKENLGGNENEYSEEQN